MISCQKCQELLPEFSLGELDGNDLRKVKFHLNSCRKCAVEAAEYRRIWNILPYTLEPVEPSSELKVQLMDRVKTSPRANKNDRLRKRQRESRVGPAFSFRLERRHKWYAIAATLLVCMITLSSLRWGSDDPTEQLFATREIKQRVERLASSYTENVPLVGQDGMPNFVYVSMRPGDGYDSVQTRPSAYAIWNRASDKWHLFVEESVNAGVGENYELLLRDPKGGLVASQAFTARSIGKLGIVFDSRTDRPITNALVALQIGPALSSRQAISRTIVLEADLITPMVPVSVE